LLVKYVNNLRHGWCKHAPEGESEPSHKHTATDLKMKIRMVLKYEGGQILCAIASELGLAVSAFNTNVKDVARVKETCQRNGKDKSLITTKVREGAISEMEKLLMLWLEAQIW
jgi:hypothetical protein